MMSSFAGVVRVGDQFVEVAHEPLAPPIHVYVVAACAPAANNAVATMAVSQPLSNLMRFMGASPRVWSKGEALKWEELEGCGSEAVITAQRGVGGTKAGCRLHDYGAEFTVTTRNKDVNVEI